MGDAIDLNMGRADTAVSDVVSRATVAENRRMQMAITRRRNKIEQAIAGALDLLSSGRLVNTGQQICCRDEQTLIDYVEQIKVNGEYALDLETTGLDPYCGEIVGFCIYTPNPAENRLYVPVGHTDAEGNIIEGQLPISRVFGILADIFEGDYRYINHMTKFDGKWIKVKYGKWIKNFYWDTWIAAKLLNENEPTHELKPLYAKYILRTRDDASSFADLFGTSIPFNYMPIDVATVYGANDGYKAYKLMEFQRKHIDDERRPDMVKIAKLLHDLEMPLVPVVGQTELNGVECDTEYCDQLHSTFENEMIGVRLKLDKFINDHANVIAANPELSRFCLDREGRINFLYSSPKQLSLLFYKVLGMPIVDRRNPEGTGKDIVLKLIERAKPYAGFLKDLLKFRELSKLLGTYIDKLPRVINPVTNRIHGSFNQYGTVTGRFSSSEPNLQNIPSHEKRIRRMFKAADGCVLIGGDFSQIEPRILAYLSGDENMIAAYRAGKDLYSSMAAEVFEKPIEECGDGTDERSTIKAVLLGIMYERTPESIAEQFKKPASWGIKVVGDFYKRFPRVKLFKMKSIHEAETLGFVTTVEGRKRRLPEMKLDRESNKYQAAYRQVVNSKIQGTSADITKRSMLNVGLHPRLIEICTKIILTVHDEIIIEVNEQYAREAAFLMRDEMIAAGQQVLIGMPIKVDLEISKCWYGESLNDIYLAG